MATEKTLSINAQTKGEYRKKLIEEFLKESSGTSSTVSEYFYYVDEVNGKRIYLKRPTQLNKGFDFEVRVEDTQFRYGKNGNVISTGNRPSHQDIINDLVAKKAENLSEFNKLKDLLDKTYNCQEISQAEYQQYNFATGFSVELILKVLKWLFIEQDITYWNRSGRYMLYSGVSELWD